MGDTVADDEAILRHIPGDPDHLAPGPRATSANFELREGETGVSVSRERLTPAAALLARLGDPATGSRIARAVVAEVRALGLDVIPKPLPEDPGHAEIEPRAADLGRRPVRRKLAKLFVILDPDGPRP